MILNPVINWTVRLAACFSDRVCPIFTDLAESPLIGQLLTGLRLSQGPSQSLSRLFHVLITSTITVRKRKGILRGSIERNEYRSFCSSRTKSNRARVCRSLTSSQRPFDPRQRNLFIPRDNRHPVTSKDPDYAIIDPDRLNDYFHAATTPNYIQIRQIQSPLNRAILPFLLYERTTGGKWGGNGICYSKFRIANNH